jgi:hypothetical protein
MSGPVHGRVVLRGAAPGQLRLPVHGAPLYDGDVGGAVGGESSVVGLRLSFW